MLTFFRRIRQTFLESGSTRRYLLYAIGEIALVVIGILIALQINNWNEWRKDRNEENQILVSLNAEFTESKVQLTKFTEIYTLKFEACKQLLELVNEDRDRLNQINVDSLLAVALNYDNFFIADGTIQDILNSDKIKIIGSDKLRATIHDWIKAVKSKDEAYSTMDQFATIQIFPYLTKKIAIKNIDRYDQLKWEKQSKFNIDNRIIFTEFEFENHINNQAWSINNFLTKLNKLDLIMASIISQTKKQ